MSPGGMGTTAGNPRSAAPAGVPRPPTRADVDSTPFLGLSATATTDQGRVRSPDHPHLDADGCGSACAGRVRSRRPGQGGRSRRLGGRAAAANGPPGRPPVPRCLPTGRFKDRGSGAVDHPAPEPAPAPPDRPGRRRAAAGCGDLFRPGAAISPGGFRAAACPTQFPGRTAGPGPGQPPVPGSQFPRSAYGSCRREPRPLRLGAGGQVSGRAPGRWRR